MSNDGTWWETYRGMVHPWHCDQFGHMNVRWYLHMFDDGAFHVWSRLGFPFSKMEALGIHTVTATVKIDYHQELKAGDPTRIEAAFTRCGTKSVSFRQRMYHADTGELHASYECVEVFFDPDARKAAAMPDEIRSLVEAALVDPDAN